MQMREDIVFTRHNTKMQLNVELLKTNTKKQQLQIMLLLLFVVTVMYMSELCKRFKKMLEKNGFNIFFFNPKFQNFYLNVLLWSK